MRIDPADVRRAANLTTASCRHASSGEDPLLSAAVDGCEKAAAVVQLAAQPCSSERQCQRQMTATVDLIDGVVASLERAQPIIEREVSDGASREALLAPDEREVSEAEAELDEAQRAFDDLPSARAQLKRFRAACGPRQPPDYSATRSQSSLVAVDVRNRYSLDYSALSTPITVDAMDATGDRHRVNRRQGQSAIVLVVGGLLVCAALGIFFSGPDRSLEPPAAALGSTVVLAAERVVVLFVAWLICVVAALRAWQGLLPIEISGQGLRYADADGTQLGLRETAALIRRTDEAMASLTTRLEDLEIRVLDNGESER